MAGLDNNWFSVPSKTERESSRKEYEQTMFPFEGSRAYITERLAANIHSSRDQADVLFQYLVLKGALMKKDEKSRDKALRSWYKNGLIRRWTAEEKAYMIALAKLDMEAESFEQLPDDEQIRAYAQTELSQELEELRRQSMGLMGFLKR